MGEKKLIKSDALANGAICKVTLDDMPALAVTRIDGVCYAVDDLCSHGEASLSDGDIEGHDIVCAWHQGAFDVRSGEATRSPCWQKIAVHEVFERDGAVYLKV